MSVGPCTCVSASSIRVGRFKKKEAPQNCHPSFPPPPLHPKDWFGRTIWSHHQLHLGRMDSSNADSTITKSSNCLSRLSTRRMSCVTLALDI
mmetsp:Transcript_48700/g.72725  ORF Transcript_48700/g.72725 Transcript_48700/m.72725 type:complete len:92 (-) Transcript_48700:491-766(-)